MLLDQRSVAGYNLFTYCWNNPINKLDKTGTQPYICEIKPFPTCDEEILNEIRNADFSVPIYRFFSKYEDEKYNVYEFQSEKETKTRYLLWIIPWGSYTEYTIVRYYFERVNKVKLFKKLEIYNFLNPIVLFINDFSSCGTTGNAYVDIAQATVGFIPMIYNHKKEKIEYEIQCTEVLRFAEITVVTDDVLFNTSKEYV